MLAVGHPPATKPPAPDVDQLTRIEAKLDSLLSASKSDPPAAYVPDRIPVDANLKAQAPDARLVALVQDYRPKGMPWGEIAKVFNERGLMSQRGKAWNHGSIETYCRRHGILGT